MCILGDEAFALADSLVDEEVDYLEEREYYAHLENLCTPRIHCNNRRYRVGKLQNSIEAPKARNEAAKVGSVCHCPICGKKFIKQSYQQKFCSNRCKVKYHNKRQVYY